MSVQLSIVLPCLNEARTVGQCVNMAKEGIASAGISGEVIVADNGSTDGSPKIAEEHGARVVHAKERGYGSAIRAGVDAADGEYILMADADESYDITHVVPFVEKLKAGCDLVMGNRFKGGIKPGAMPWLHHYIGNPLLTGALNLFFRSGIGDAHSGIRAFRKDAFATWDLTTTGMEFASEMVVKAKLSGSRIGEVPVILYPDRRGRAPHLRSFRDGWRHLKFLLLFCPLWLYLIPSSILFFGGLFLMIWLTPGAQVIGGLRLDIHTMLLGTLCALLGYQTLWLWAYSKVFGWTTGLLPRGKGARSALHQLTLERCVIFGGLLLLLGLGFNSWLVYEWSETGFGPLDAVETLRSALWGLLLMVMGVQTIYGGFFLGMLGLMPQKKL